MANRSEVIDPSELVEVFANSDGILVGIARDQLAGCHIDGFIFDADTSRIFGIGRRLLVPVRLMVHTQDADRARMCLRDLGFPL
ncbi:MAG TPA: DUF2007 domain-containing protein [Candidatus Binataceae bacterium]|nr:DUF2007 domain-containing protein [Candidatus Binataceae bacterium]